MYKYWLLFQLHWQNTLTYPISFILWRVRMLMATLVAITLWSSIFQHQTSVFSYTANEMVTYIFLIAGLQSVILATSLNGLAQDIYNGNISKLFLQPFQPLRVFVTNELADKSMNVLGSVIETFLLWWWFRPLVVLPDLAHAVPFVLLLGIGMAIMFWAMLLIGCLGFYTPESWGVRFLFYMVAELTAGRLFPLDIFPPIFKNTLWFTPFPFLSYHQTQVFLQHYSPAQSWQLVAAGSVWVIGLGLIFHYYWQKGLKEYGAMGR
jgi:ABC-2 type transport system permease protein